MLMADGDAHGRAHLCFPSLARTETGCSAWATGSPGGWRSQKRRGLCVESWRSNRRSRCYCMGQFVEKVYVIVPERGPTLVRLL